MTPEPIRIRRIRAFLWTHLGLCALAGVVATVENLHGLQATRTDQLINLAVFGLPTLVTGLGWWAFRRRRFLGLLIPAILAFDSLLALGQQFREGDFETPWTGVPILTLVMLPLFSDRARLVWVLAGIQIAGFIGLLYARAEGLLPYRLRTPDLVHDPDHQVFMAIAYVTVVIAAAVLAGRTSVDVLNSQAQLREILERQERELQAAQAVIVQQEKMASVGQLTAGIAHEINNPLTFVRTNLTSLSRDLGDLMDVLALYRQFDGRLRELDPEAAADISARLEDLCMDDPKQELGSLLGDACDGVDRVQEIIRDLRIFSRLDEAELQKVDLREGIASTLKFLQHALDERGVQVVQQLDPIPEVEVYAALLNQVFMNLLQNAADVVPAQTGVIRISTRATDGRLFVEIADNGPGIPPEIRERIFDPFFTTKEVGQGTGLGLSLSLQIVRKHGGALHAADAPEGGALLTLSLPVARA